MKSFDQRKKLLLIKSNADIPQLFRDLNKIRGDTYSYFHRDRSNLFDDRATSELLLSKKQHSIFIQDLQRNNANFLRKMKLKAKKQKEIFGEIDTDIQKNKKNLSVGESDELNKTREKLIFGRQFDREIIDCVEFELIEYKSIAEYLKENVSKEAPVLNCAYFTLFVGIKNERIINLFTDIFAQKTNEICLDFVNYALVIKELSCENENNEEISYEICLNEIKGSETIPIGPFLKIKLLRSWFCNQERFDFACSREKEKKIKNISVNEMKDTIGTLHMEKQDLKEINLKKRRKYSKNEADKK